MQLIPDDPLIAHAMRTGYPLWVKEDPPYWEDEKEDEERKEDENVSDGN